jgi:hypothetical protein
VDFSGDTLASKITVTDRNFPIRWFFPVPWKWGFADVTGAWMSPFFEGFWGFVRIEIPNVEVRKYWVGIRSMN